MAQNRNELASVLKDLEYALNEIRRIRIDLVKFATNPEMVRALAKRLEDLL